MKNPFKKSRVKAVVQEEFKAYQVVWICNEGHKNFQTVIGKEGTQRDVCLKCGKHYEYEIE